MSSELDNILSKQDKKEMIDFLVSLVNEFPTTAIKESLVDFVEKNRILTAGTSARPGPYRFSVTPYMREPTEALSDYTYITEIAMIKATQTGGTEALINHELYCIKHGIGPCLYVTSDDNLAGEHMEKRISVGIDASGLQENIQPPVIRKSNKGTGDSRRAKSYRGTFLRAIGSRSESKLSSFPIRVIHMDEVDKYPISLIGGGSAIEAAVRRADGYGALKKIFYISTPKNKATSRIEPLFLQGDARYYHVPCPKCGFLQRLLWSQIKWSKNQDGELDIRMDHDGKLLNSPVWHECANPECKNKMKDYQKYSFMQEKNHGGKAEWRPSKQSDRPGLRSYHINGLYGFRSWIDIVLQWCSIQGDIDLLFSFTTDVLAESFHQKIDKPDRHFLAARAESDFLRGDVNRKVKAITAGIDVHADRLEMSLIGWTDKRESWTIDHLIYQGITSDADDDCFNVLEEQLKKDYFRTDGSKLKINIALIDAAFNTAAVMHFCERFSHYGDQNKLQGVYPCFGKLTLSEIVKEHKSTISVPEILLADQRLKREIYTNLKRKVPAAGHAYQPGFCHFPIDFSEDFYKQLTAEEVKETSNSKGVTSILIANTRQARNEALDCHKMALGALYYLFLKYFELQNAHRKLRKRKPINPDWNYFWSLFDEAKTEENEKIKI